MRLLLSFLLLSFYFISQAQNVGIGKTNPTETLDVNGNVNVDGKIKLNGNAGQPGQTLMVQSDGTQKWMNSFGYKNRTIVSATGTWTVPAGVRELMLEVVGGGGGGAKGGGGGGGGYLIVGVKVVPGQTINVTYFGSPSSGGPSETENGSAFAGRTINVAGTGFEIISDGGGGATNQRPGFGGYGSVIQGDSLFYQMIYGGGNGGPLVESYSQRTATEFVTMRKQGDGGVCMINPSNISKGGFFSFNTQTQLNLTFVPSSYSTVCFGCGGAGGNTLISDVLPAWGGIGGSPIVFISY